MGIWKTSASLNIWTRQLFLYCKISFPGILLYQCIAHWSRFPIFYQQVFFSRLLADFDAQYGKLGVLGVRQSIFEKKNIWPQRSKTFKVTFKVWKSQIYACPASLCTFSASKIKCPSNQNVLTYQRSPFDLWNLQYDL